MAPVDRHLKEFLEGVREIATAVRAILARARQTSSNLFMTFLELDDPYDNILHSAAMKAIQGLPMAGLVKQIVMVGQEFRRPGRGIMNSLECETSRMVLAFCMNPVIAAIDESKGFAMSSTKKFAVKAFVEKLVIIAATEDGMKEHLNKVGDALKEIGLEKIDAEHCRYVAVTFDNGQMSVRSDLDFTLAEQKIQGVQKGESWKFLGEKFVVK